MRDHERFAMSYITGSHNFKAGFDLNQFSEGRAELRRPQPRQPGDLVHVPEPDAAVGVDLREAIRDVSSGTENATLRAGSVDHPEADAEPGPAVQRL